MAGYGRIFYLFISSTDGTSIVPTHVRSWRVWWKKISWQWAMHLGRVTSQKHPYLTSGFGENQSSLAADGDIPGSWDPFYQVLSSQSSPAYQAWPATPLLTNIYSLTTTYHDIPLLLSTFNHDIPRLTSYSLSLGARPQARGSPHLCSQGGLYRNRSGANLRSCWTIWAHCRDWDALGGVGMLTLNPIFSNHLSHLDDVGRIGRRRNVDTPDLIHLTNHQWIILKPSTWDSSEIKTQVLGNVDDCWIVKYNDVPMVSSSASWCQHA